MSWEAPDVFPQIFLIQAIETARRTLNGQLLMSPVVLPQFRIDLELLGAEGTRIGAVSSVSGDVIPESISRCEFSLAHIADVFLL